MLYCTYKNKNMRRTPQRWYFLYVTSKWESFGAFAIIFFTIIVVGDVVVVVLVVVTEKGVISLFFVCNLRVSIYNFYSFFYIQQHQKGVKPTTATTKLHCSLYIRVFLIFR